MTDGLVTGAGRGGGLVDCGWGGGAGFAAGEAVAAGAGLAEPPPAGGFRISKTS
jgi:hypothetical protein